MSPIQRLLVLNRGEIAARIISSARELDIETIAVYTENDIGHIYNATHAVRLSSPAAYLDIDEVLSVARANRIDAVHPGYGFLSESPELAQRMDEMGVKVVGPGRDVLKRTGDKLEARLLAVECNVPVLPALTEPTSRVDSVKVFAEKVGLPVMVKAVDGGGGRGIRLIRKFGDLQSFVTRAIEESPTRQVFAEKAAVDGFRHVEIQIVGDGHGNVTHLWERECSIQRRYQKVVELAPSTVNDRHAIAPVIEAAVRMAKKIQYRSLGTFEFLLNPASSEHYFLEINPRLQVEHTITESICATDIVAAQLRIAQGATLAEAGLDATNDPGRAPDQRSIQLRITAEDPEKNWSLSIGKVQGFHFPSGNGVRVDTALVHGAPAIVSADFDSVIAKVIITASTWPGAVAKAKRALEDTVITGVTTNLAMLRAIVANPSFLAGECDTQWLEAQHDQLLRQSRAIAASTKNPFHGLASLQSSTPSSSTVSTASTLFRKDDAWSLTLSPKGQGDDQEQAQHHLLLTKVLRNDFPTSLAAEIQFTSPNSQPVPYTVSMQATNASASALSSQHRQGSTGDPSHVVVPFSGKLVEVLVDEGDRVKKGDVVCVIKQMKMELEVRAHRGGVCSWVMEVEDGEDVAEGILAAVLDEEKREAKL
ncbi:hypothetical protein MBLNU230_g2857t1 [Neophaeotheca triangularis]